MADAASVSDASDDLPPLTSAELQPKHPHRLITVVVDHLHRDPTRLRFREGAAFGAVEAGPGVFVHFGFQCGFELLEGVLAAQEVGVADEEAAPRDQLAMVWRKDADGTPILIQVTDEGLRAIGIDPN